MAASRRVYDSRHCRLTAKNRILHYNIFFYCHVCSEIGVKLCVLGTSSSDILSDTRRRKNLS